MNQTQKRFIGWGFVPGPKGLGCVRNCGEFETPEAATAAPAATGLELAEVETVYRAPATKKCAIDTTRHDRSHGKPPRGRGGWLFESEDGAIVFNHSGTYAEARTAAMTWGKANGYSVLYVCP